MNKQGAPCTELYQII